MGSEREAPLYRPRPDTPATDEFQLQLAADGRCRLVLGPAEAPTAVLDLGAPEADRLAKELAKRRATYDEARQRERGARH